MRSAIAPSVKALEEVKGGAADGAEKEPRGLLGGLDLGLRASFDKLESSSESRRSEGRRPVERPLLPPVELSAAAEAWTARAGASDTM